MQHGEVLGPVGVALERGSGGLGVGERNGEHGDDRDDQLVHFNYLALARRRNFALAGYL